MSKLRYLQPQAPRLSRQRVEGETWVSLPIRLGVRKESRKLCQQGVGQSLGQKLILCIFEVRRSHLRQFSVGQAHIKMSLFKKHYVERYVGAMPVATCG